METFVTLLIPALLTLALVRLLFLPLQGLFKLGIHAGLGLVCLALLNSVSGFTGVYLPVNAITVLTAGFLGVPGIGIIALLKIL